MHKYAKTTFLLVLPFIASCNASNDDSVYLYRSASLVERDLEAGRGFGLIDLHRTWSPIFETLPPTSLEAIYYDPWRCDFWFHDPSMLKLCEAINTRNSAKIVKAINSGCDPNAVGARGMPILFWSYFRGYEVVETLLTNGADPNIVLLDDYKIYSRYSIKDSTLLYATLTLSSLCKPEANPFHGYANLLLDHGARATERNDESPLLLVVRLRDPDGVYFPEYDLAFIEKLIACGANVDFTTKNCKYNAVSTASVKFDFTALESLLTHGAKLDVSTFPGREAQRAIFYYLGKMKEHSPNYVAPNRAEHNAALERVVKILSERGVSLDAPEEIQDDWEREQAGPITRRLLPEVYPDHNLMERDFPAATSANEVSAPSTTE